MTWNGRVHPRKICAAPSCFSDHHLRADQPITLTPLPPFLLAGHFLLSPRTAVAPSGVSSHSKSYTAQPLVCQITCA